ncbi:MAG: ankyrin repeat domain-containing protein [Candidatus Babeliales bacterium]|jgi:ankyrin repeat protein
MNTFTRLLLCGVVFVGGMVVSKNLSAYYGQPYYQSSSSPIYDAVMSSDYNGAQNALMGAQAAGTLENEINVQDAYGDTPLHIAAKKGDSQMVQLLVSWGARKDIPNNNGDYPEAVATGRCGRFLK